MEFSYELYKINGFNRPDYFGALGFVTSVEFGKLQEQYENNKHTVSRSLSELKKRTTPDYYSKVYRAQTGALSYSRKVFPTYKFIMPDALTDDWLSTVDWHKRYPTRDHSLHQTLTAYIVAQLLGNGIEENSLRLPDNDNLLNYCCNRILEGGKTEYLMNYAKSIGVNIDEMPSVMKRLWVKDVFYEAAIISALFHDMGYPWQYVNRLAKSMELAEYGDTTDVVTNDMRSFEAIKNRLLIYPFYGYSETNIRHGSEQLRRNVIRMINKGLKETHGLPGALGFMCLNDKIRRYSQIPSFAEASYRLILDWAAVGIMMHDMVDLYRESQNKILRLSFDLDPLSSIVSMADLLEEFYRPYAKFQKNASGTSVDLKYDFPCNETEIFIKGNTLFVRFKYNNAMDAALNRKRRQEEVNNYLGYGNGYIDLSSLGIMNVDCDTVVNTTKSTV